MSDRSISINAAGALALWVIGIVLALIDLFSATVNVGQLGMITCAGGAVLNVRGYFCQMAYRERNAFEIGREYERETLHSV